jgi:Ca2+-binding RTX toxin-like protein
MKFRIVISNRKTQVTRKSGLRRSLMLESLESRRVLSVNPGQVILNNTNLIVYGSSSDDTVVISEKEPGIINLVWRSEGERFSQDFSKAEITKIRFYGGDGSDTFNNATDLPCAAYGEGGDDKLVGGSGVDELDGGEGNDSLFGGDGNDRLLGGAGNDVIRGDEGNDTINGQVGDDIIYGHGGADHIFGMEGNDRIYGGDGNDSIYGGEGNDILYGDGGDDLADGGEGNDSLFGGDGNDRLLGGAGNDVIRGDEGNDTINGQAGDDIIYGHGGADYILGAAGNDQIYGGDGNDSIDGGEGNNILYGDGGDDLIVGGGDSEMIYGGAGDDRIFGGAGNDVIRGEEGNDAINGQSGDDIIYGHGGADYILGAAGNDQIYGGDGNDSIYGGEGNNSLYGESGNDLIVGGGDGETLYGGAGDDILLGGAGVDYLTGESGGDLLIGGLVTHSAELLEILCAKWTSGANYHDRVHAIEDEGFAAYLQSEKTVFDDYVADTVVGGDDLDWFFLPGSMSVYDPNGMHPSTVSDDQQHHSSGSHGIHVIDHLPIVEGFDLIDSLDKLRDVSDDESIHTIVPHIDNGSKQTEHLALFELVRYDQVTHYAVSSGNWSDSRIWHDGVVPTSGARVLIPIGVQVNVDRVLTTKIATLRIDGILSFATQVNTQLKVDTAIVSDVGTLIIGTESNPVAVNVTAKLIFADYGEIDRKWDPYGISRGLITHGAVEIHGAAKTSSLELVGEVRAGTTVLTLAGIPAGWRVGDRVVVAGTTAGQSEERNILGIFGKNIIVSPLTYDHLTFAVGQTVNIANTTRNIILDSESSVTARRGHVMFMHNPNVHIYYAGFYKLGRTDKSVVINDPVVDADWNLVPGTGTNPRARYAVHFHRTGTSASGSPATVVGSVVADNSGWGFVNHSSYVDFTSNVAYNVLGAGFVTEVGDEIGTFRDNIAIGMKASGESVEARLVAQDHGHTGDGFWFQGAGITVVDNVAADAEGHGFVFYTRGLTFGGNKPHFLTENLTDPSLANGADWIASDYVPIKEFSGNVSYSSGVGLALWYNLRDAPHSTFSIFKDSSFWNNEVGIEMPYSHSIVLQNLNIQKDTTNFGMYGVRTNTVSKNIMFNNLSISGYRVGIEAARRGSSIINGGTFSTLIGVLVGPAAESGRIVSVRGSFKMAAIPKDYQRSDGQLDVSHRFDDMAINHSIQHIFYDSKVVLSYGSYRNQQLYSSAQIRDAVLFPDAEPYIPREYVGLTAGQIAAKYGLIVHGEFAPSTAKPVSGLGGLLGRSPL